MTNELVKFENVGFSYQGNENFCLQGINFSLDKGQVLTIMGGNGSGKSTVIKLLLGIEKPVSGKVLVETSNFGIVFQQPLNNFVCENVKDDLTLTAKLSYNPQEAEKAVSDICNKLNINNLLKREITSLSGGQMQVLALANCLLKKPQLIILDESLSMLDNESQDYYLQILKEVKDSEDTAFVKITHNLNEAILCDKLIFIERGKQTFYGTATQFCNAHKDIINLNNSVMLQTDFIKQGLLKNYVSENEFKGWLCRLK
jgi:energy-coupling factor transport system ATP-binding protein